MSNQTEILAIFLQMEEAIRRIERRFSWIQCPKDFLKDDRGLDALDGISMMLIAVSENLKRLEKRVGTKVFDQFPRVPWRDVIGIRNILSHDYFNIDAEEIYQICATELPLLKENLSQIRALLLS
ncbi:MAG: DUF86 domain-containing protein [Synechocystis sp.]|nr:DUF86 domain-containing protein [Synechocystis sp.]